MHMRNTHTHTHIPKYPGNAGGTFKQTKKDNNTVPPMFESCLILTTQKKHYPAHILINPCTNTKTDNKKKSSQCSVTLWYAADGLYTVVTSTGKTEGPAGLPFLPGAVGSVEAAMKEASCISWKTWRWWSNTQPLLSMLRNSSTGGW